MSKPQEAPPHPLAPREMPLKDPGTCSISGAKYSGVPQNVMSRRVGARRRAVDEEEVEEEEEDRPTEASLPPTPNNCD